MVGPSLVAKQTLHKELMYTHNFHVNFCKTQAEAQTLAKLFNRLAHGPPSWAVSFLDCHTYLVRDVNWPGGRVEFIAEQVGGL